MNEEEERIVMQNLFNDVTAYISVLDDMLAADTVTDKDELLQSKRNLEQRLEQLNSFLNPSNESKNKKM